MGAVQPSAFGFAEGDALAKEGEIRFAEGFDELGLLGGDGNPKGAERFARFLVPARGVFPGAKAGTGAVQEEIALFDGGSDGLGAFENDDLGEALLQKLAGAVIEIARPETHLGVEGELFHELEHAEVVGDVADVLALPGVAEKDARGTAGLGGGAERRGEGGSEGGLEEGAPGVHEGGWEVQSEK